MRPAPTIPSGLALLVAVGLLLAGCGGGDATSSTSAQGKPAATSPADSGERQAPSAGSTTSPSRQSSDRPSQDLPPPTPGTKAAAPGVPTSKQGDNSIQTYGLEAEDTERAQATALVQAYLDARAAGDWAKVCSYLAAKPRAEQSRYAKGASCAKAMEAFAAGASSAILAEEADIQVLSFRVGPEYAFLIYRRPDGVYATALDREGGAWKVVSVGPSPVE